MVLKKWLQKYAEEVEQAIDKPIHCRIGNYKGEYHKGNGEFTKIEGGLFLTTHQGNLFKVYDKNKQIEDTFDIFSKESEIIINEKLFPYVLNKQVISISQIDTDIKWLNNRFIQWSGAWENNDGDYECIEIAKQELNLVKSIATRYPFKYEYEPSLFDKNPNDMDENWSNTPFSVDDFKNENINKDNYRKVDAVAFDFKEQLVGMLDKLKEELEWLPPRFRQEFIEEIIGSSNQDRHSIRKNCEFFIDTIMDELTKKENEQMFITIG